MTEKMGGKVPQDLPPDSDTTAVNKTKAQLVAEAKAAGIKVPSRATKAEVQALLEANQADSGSDDSDQTTDEASTPQDEPSVGLFDDIDETNPADVNSDDTDEASDDADQTTDDSDESNDTDGADQAADESNDTDEAPVGLVTDQGTDEADQTTDDSDESNDTDGADQAADESDDSDDSDGADQAADDSDDSDQTTDEASTPQDEPSVGLFDDIIDETNPADVNSDDTDEASDDADQAADDSDDSADHVSLADRVKAAASRLNFGSRRTRVILIGLVALAALIAAMVVVSVNSDDGSDDNVVTPAVTVDDVFSGLCETAGEVDLTTMPVAGFSLDGLNTDGTDDAATVQSRVVDDYFVDTSLGCSPQGIEFLRTGVDQARIDADRPGLDTRDSAGRIAYNSENPDEALVVAEYLNKVMSECAAEMVVLSEADIQDGLYVLTFTDGSYGDLVWVKMPVETALSGVDSIGAVSCTIGLVEGSDGLTRSFMYSEGLGTFVSVETPFGNTVEYVPAPVEETGVEPVTVTDEPKAPEVISDQANAADDAAPEVEEPEPTPGTEVEQAEEPATTPEPEPTPGTEVEQAEEPATTPEPEPTPGTEVEQAEEPATTPEPEPTPAADEPKADPPKAEEPSDTADEATEVKPDTPADDASTAPVLPVDAGDAGVISGGNDDGIGPGNDDGLSDGGDTCGTSTCPGTVPGNQPGTDTGGCVGVCIGQGGNGGNGGNDGCVGTCPGDGGSQGGCNVDCDEPQPEDMSEETPEEEPEEDPQDECIAPNTLDPFGNCKAPPVGGAVDL